MTSSQASRPLRRDRPGDVVADALLVPASRERFAGLATFDYHCRRSRQEEVAAVSASTEVAAASHRALSRLHAAQAVAILIGRRAMLH